MKEEFRTHSNYSGRSRFLSFPIFVFVAVFGSGLTLETMLETVSLERFATFAHLGAFLYGLSVGAFGIMGREYLDRRYGRNNYLIAMPYLLPLSFRTTFLGIYLRDVLFYILLMLVPATLGLVASAPIMGFSLVSIGLLFVAMILTFLIGMSLSFLASVVYIRNTRAFVAMTAAVAVIFVAHGAFGVPALEAIMPGLGFQMNVRPFGSDWAEASYYALACAGASALMTALAYALVEVRISVQSKEHADLLPSYYKRIRMAEGLRRTLMAKELLDLRRSGVVAKMFFAFILPLLFLSFTTWYVNYGLAIPVGFNAVFYSAMVGFVAVMMYNWLNNIDLAEYYSLLPVTVPQLVRIRIAVFLILTLGISAFFVVAISIMNGETELIWLALIVMVVTSLYMVVLTAYLTGLKTNSFLFDTSVLMKFTVLSFLPDLCLTILSFSLLSSSTYAVMGIALVLGSMAVTTRILYKGIESKWARTSFDA